MELNKMNSSNIIYMIINLSKGIKRVLLVSSFLFAIVFQYIYDKHNFFDLEDKDFWYPLTGGWLIYWLSVLIVIWIISGFIKGEKLEDEIEQNITKISNVIKRICYIIMIIVGIFLFIVPILIGFWYQGNNPDYKKYSYLVDIIHNDIEILFAMSIIGLVILCIINIKRNKNIQ